MNDEQPQMIDGYGNPFDPEKHIQYVREGITAVVSSTYHNPCNTGHIDHNLLPKTKPAGWWDKTGRQFA